MSPFSLVGCAVLVAGAALTTTAAAQTTGVPGFNDYTVGGLGAGSVSCTALTVPAGPTLFTLMTEPGAPSTLFLFNVNCLCSPCFLPWPVETGCGVPLTACTGTSNHALELDPATTGCFFIGLPGPPATAAGVASISLTLPPTARFSTQAITIHSCATGSLLFSQSYFVDTP